VVVTFDDTGERKPSPLPFKTVLSRLDVDPKYALMVGDWAERDMVGARNVGMKTAFAKYGDSFGNQDVRDVDYILNDIKDLLEIVA
jgi:putative hydrolase of the HAD superfamily